MKKSNYEFLFNPVARPGGYGFDIKITREFKEFAASQRVNNESYENLIRRLVREHMKIDPEHYHQELCGWDSGLLWKIEIPGNAAGISLEKHMGENLYHSHNIDSPVQTIILFDVIFRYFSDVESRIHDVF